MKMNITLLAFTLLCIFLIACSKETPKEKDIIREIAVKQIPSSDEEILEEWVNVTENEEILGVSATRSKSEWSWTVSIYAAEYIREEPLESELYESINKALTTVPGVAAIDHEDREVWIIKGNPKGEDLVKACVNALYKHLEAMQQTLNNLKENAS